MDKKTKEQTNKLKRTKDKRTKSNKLKRTKDKRTKTNKLSHKIKNYAILDSSQISHQFYNYEIWDSGQISTAMRYMILVKYLTNSTTMIYWIKSYISLNLLMIY